MTEEKHILNCYSGKRTLLYKQVLASDLIHGAVSNFVQIGPAVQEMMFFGDVFAKIMIMQISSKSNIADINGPRGKVVPCEWWNLYTKFRDFSSKGSTLRVNLRDVTF